MPGLMRVISSFTKKLSAAGVVDTVSGCLSFGQLSTNTYAADSSKHSCRQTEELAVQPFKC